MSRLQYALLFAVTLGPTAAHANGVEEAAMGKAVERHLPTDTPFMQWTQDPERLAAEGGDRLENREAVRSELETVKLSGLVPPIRFESGVADIPQTTVI